MLLRVVGATARADRAAGAGRRAAPAHPGRILGARDRLLRARPRRARAAGPDHHVESGAPALRRRRAERARVAARRRAPRRGAVQRLGRAHAGARAGGVQSALLSQRVGVAARQRAHRARRGAPRSQRRGAAHPRGALPWRRDTSVAGACPSCSAASGAARATFSCTTRCRARRRRGPRARSSCCCKRVSACGPTRRRARSPSAIRGCRRSSTRSICAACASASALVSLHFARHGARTHCDVLEVTGDRLRVNIEV